MLKPTDNHTIPELTRIVAKNAFPNGSIVMTMRDELGVVFTDEMFADLYPALGQPAFSPARLALVTIMQYIENMGDRQAAEAVRGRIDWKYALGLELSDAGFNFSVLSEFRRRLTDGGVERLLLERVLARCDELGLLKGKQQQRTDATHVLGAVRQLGLLELAGESLRRTLDEVAQLAPEWLVAWVPADWTRRYGRRFDSQYMAKSKAKWHALLETVARDGYQFLEAAYGADAPAVVRRLPCIDLLRCIWLQRFYRTDETVHLRTEKQWGRLPSKYLIASLDDRDATHCIKRSTEWVGYRVHLTETCHSDHPRLITHVETTTAASHDSKVTATIQDALTERNLKPETHLVDEGYMEIDLLLDAQQRDIDLLGPVPSGKSWQARTDGAFDHTMFDIDWQKRVATCPAGVQSRSCSDRKTWRGTTNLLFTFDKHICRACDVRQHCSRSKHSGRTLTVYPQERYEAQEAARQRQRSEPFRKQYAARAGVEGAISQAVRRCDIRNARYIGLSKTHLQHVASAAAINVVRVTNWLRGERPEPSRISPFQALTAPLST